MTAFDQKAAEWDLNPERLKLHSKIAQKIIDRVPLQSNWRTLEFGCGTGLMSFLLADKLGQIDCIDTSAGMIEELNKKLTLPNAPENISAHCRLLEQDTFAADSFDFLFTILALHHIEDVESIIKILGGIVKKGGHIALVDLDKEDGSFHQGTEMGVHHNGFGRDYIQHLLEAEGFGLTTAETAAFRKREQEDGSTKSYPLFLISGRKI
jgi:ubiquinone/menaquinone biosynthesis C-methylase UbiE